jgi:hypothetical protein
MTSRPRHTNASNRIFVIVCPNRGGTLSNYIRLALLLFPSGKVSRAIFAFYLLSGIFPYHESLNSRHLSTATLALGMVAAAISVALTIRCYMPCPFGDEWFIVDGVARGRGPLDWSWLFGQHNEHRVAIPRALIWLDLAVFHGKNISLFAGIWLVLLLHWAVIAYALERFTDFPTPLKRTLQGLFAFCIFHPNQSENLTWAFQIGFVLPFAIATAALLATVFFQRLRRPQFVQTWFATFGVAAAPILAALNMAGGLLIGPVVLWLAFIQRLPRRFIVIVVTVFLLTAGAYLWGLKPPDPAHPPQAALADPKGIFVYILTYFGASWTRILPHKERITAFLSIVCFAVLVIRSLPKRRPLSDFERFCVAECAFLLSIAFVTALGRLKFGVGQAFASRYQTPAMLYWAALGALVLIRLWRARPDRIRLAQAVLLLLMLASTLTFFKIWRAATTRADSLQSACQVVKVSDNQTAAKTLYATDAGLEPAAAFLRRLWSGSKSTSR